MRQEVRQAVAQGNRGRALELLGDLSEEQLETPEALLELVGLMIGAGEAPHAVWLLEAGTLRFPERADVRLALAQASLLVNDASHALFFALHPHQCGTVRFALLNVQKRSNRVDRVGII